MAFLAAAFQKLLFSALLAAVLAAAFQYEVGDTMAWKKPTLKDPKTYNEWAAQNRFRIADTLHFKYQNDSVLVVTSADYSTCNASNPIAKFEDGSTVFRFDRPGFFYFISGNPGHCKSGQRLIVRVMHPTHIAAPEAAPAPAPVWESGGEVGPPQAASSNGVVFAVSFFVTALAGLSVVLCLLM